MKHISYLLILIFFVSCSQKRTDNNTKSTELGTIKVFDDLSKEKTDTIDKIKNNCSDKRINLEEILNQKHNNYLASIDDSVLSLCCYQVLDIIPSIDFNKFNKTTEEYKSENQIKTVDVYYLENSYLKEFYNDQTEVMHKDLICGKIDNYKLISSSSIQIGMTKTQLFEKIFQPTEIFKKVNRLDIYENVLGESFTSYRFINDTLKEIIFDSDYDWIDKELKK